MIQPQVDTCTCGAAIVWAQNPETRRWSPFDARPERLYVLHPGEDGVLRWQSQAVYRPHWATCQHSYQHRKEPIPRPAPMKGDPIQKSRRDLD